MSVDFFDGFSLPFDSNFWRLTVGEIVCPVLIGQAAAGVCWADPSAEVFTGKAEVPRFGEPFWLSSYSDYEPNKLVLNTISFGYKYFGVRFHGWHVERNLPQGQPFIEVPATSIDDHGISINLQTTTTLDETENPTAPTTGINFLVRVGNLASASYTFPPNVQASDVMQFEDKHNLSIYSPTSQNTAQKTVTKLRGNFLSEINSAKYEYGDVLEVKFVYNPQTQLEALVLRVNGIDLIYYDQQNVPQKMLPIFSFPATAEYFVIWPPAGRNYGSPGGGLRGSIRAVYFGDYMEPGPTDWLGPGFRVTRAWHRLPNEDDPPRAFDEWEKFTVPPGDPFHDPEYLRYPDSDYAYIATNVPDARQTFIPIQPDIGKPLIANIKNRASVAGGWRMPNFPWPPPVGTFSTVYFNYIYGPGGTDIGSGADEIPGLTQMIDFQTYYPRSTVFFGPLNPVTFQPWTYMDFQNNFGFKLVGFNPYL